MAQDPRALLQKVSLSYPTNYTDPQHPHLQGTTADHEPYRQTRRYKAQVEASVSSADEQKSTKMQQIFTRKPRTPSGCKSKVYSLPLLHETSLPWTIPLTTLSLHRQRGRSSVRACRRHSNQEPQRARRRRKHPHRSLQILPEIRP